jgi:hypothetical protein
MCTLERCKDVKLALLDSTHERAAERYKSDARAQEVAIRQMYRHKQMDARSRTLLVITRKIIKSCKQINYSLKQDVKADEKLPQILSRYCALRLSPVCKWLKLIIVFVVFAPSGRERDAKMEPIQ